MHYNKNIPVKTKAEITEIELKMKAHFKILGERFRKLREDDILYSIQDVENEIGLKRGSLNRLEIGEGTTIFSFLNLVSFYTNKGYSLDWLLSLDNSNYMRKSEDIDFISFDKEKIAKMSARLANSIINHLVRYNDDLMNTLDINTQFKNLINEAQLDQDDVDPDIINGFDKIEDYLADLEISDDYEKELKKFSNKGK